MNANITRDFNIKVTKSQHKKDATKKNVRGNKKNCV
jgi:hypothetical protein